MIVCPHGRVKEPPTGVAGDFAECSCCHNWYSLPVHGDGCHICFPAEWNPANNSRAMLITPLKKGHHA